MPSHNHIQKTINILKEEFQPCEMYTIGCIQCQIGRIIEDLEGVIELMKGE